MALTLAKLMQPPSNMVLHSSERSQDEPRTPGIRVFPTKNPNQNVLLNATYNHFTITNHYRSQPQIDENKRLKEAYKTLEKKHKTLKKLMNETMPLLNFIEIERLPSETALQLIELKTRWQNATNKRKIEEEPQFSSKKQCK